MTGLSELESDRTSIVEEIRGLGDMRRGSLSARVRPCGKPNCRCRKPGGRGHGPTYSLTYKVAGRTKMETIPAHLVPEVRQQLENRRRFGELSRRLLEVNDAICRLRSEGNRESDAKKNSVRKSKRRLAERSTGS